MAKRTISFSSGSSFAAAARSRRLGSVLVAGLSLDHPVVSGDGGDFGTSGFRLLTTLSASLCLFCTSRE